MCVVQGDQINMAVYSSGTTSKEPEHHGHVYLVGLLQILWLEILVLCTVFNIELLDTIDRHQGILVDGQNKVLWVRFDVMSAIDFISK